MNRIIFSTLLFLGAFIGTNSLPAILPERISDSVPIENSSNYETVSPVTNNRYPADTIAVSYNEATGIPDSQQTDTDTSSIYKISICKLDHDTYGFTYPVTYAFSIPDNSKDLAAYKRYSTTTEWIEIQAKSSSDFFNGTEAVRFDYPATKVYFSLPFDPNSDEIYVKVTNHSGLEVPISYLGIPDYYDNRRVVVTITMDDIGTTPPWGGNEAYLQASKLFADSQIWWTPGIMTEGLDVDWKVYQDGINQGYLEVAGHSRSHPAPPYTDYDSEIGGCKTDILNNLTLPYSRGNQGYVWCWIEPFGLTSDMVKQKLGEYGYLVSRLSVEMYKGNLSTPWAEWDNSGRHYGRAWASVSLDVDNIDHMNNTFDQIYKDNGIYHIWGHIGKIDWTNGSIAYNHFQHIKGKHDIWYAGFGQMYMYHYAKRVISVSPVITTSGQFIITSESNGRGTISPPGKVAVDTYSSQTFFITPEHGYHISNILIDGITIGKSSSYTFTSIDNNHIISAYFEQDDNSTFNITANAGEHGYLNPTGLIKVNANASQTILISAATGYHIDDVFVDGISVGVVQAYTFTDINADHSISATFAEGTPVKSTGYSSGEENSSIQNEPGTMSLTPYINNDGLFNLATVLKSQDGKIEINIQKGVLSKTTDGTTLKVVKILPSNEELPVINNNQYISMTYDLAPDSVTFSPPLTLIFNYNSAELPIDIDLNSLVIAKYDKHNKTWQTCQSIHDKPGSRVITNVDHFSKYALAGNRLTQTAGLNTNTNSPAFFTVTNLAVNSDTFVQGNPVYISAKVNNTGETDGSCEVMLKLDGVVIKTKRVDLNGGTTSDITFEVDNLTPGNHFIDINGASGTFTIEDNQLTKTTPVVHTRSTPSWLVIIVIFAVTGILAAVIIRKQHK